MRRQRVAFAGKYSHNRNSFPANRSEPMAFTLSCHEPRDWDFGIGTILSWEGVNPGKRLSAKATLVMQFREELS